MAIFNFNYDAPARKREAIAEEDRQRKLDETRFQRAAQQFRAGNEAGGLQILNEKGQDWAKAIPAEDGSIALLKTTGDMVKLTPEQFFYASTGQIKDPLDVAEKQAKVNEAEANARVTQGTVDSRINQSAQTATGLESQNTWNQNVRDYTVKQRPVVEANDKAAEARLAADEARRVAAEGRTVNKTDYDVSRRTHDEWAENAKLGIYAQESATKAAKAGDTSRLSLAERKDVSAVLDKVNEALYAYGDKPQYQAALNSMSLLPFNMAQKVVAQAAADLANTPATKDEKDVAKRTAMETFLKIAQTQMKARQATEQEEGGLTTGMPAQPPAQATPAQPAQPPASPLSKAQIQDLVRYGPPPVSPVRPGQAPTPGPMMAPQTKATPPTLRPPGPQAPSPQAGPKVSAMASGGDTNELTQAIMTMLRNNLITREQAKQLAGQSGL